MNFLMFYEVSSGSADSFLVNYDKINPPASWKHVNYYKINPPASWKVPPGGGPKARYNKREP